MQAATITEMPDHLLPADDAAQPERARVSVGVVLIWIYIFWLLTTPYGSPRLEFLTTIRFERILAAVLALYTIGTWGVRWRNPVPGILLFGFFAASLLSALVSPSETTPDTQHWMDNYWKLCLLYWFIIVGIKSTNDAYLVMAGTAVISIGYQLLSWRDYMAGGAYVWQQGIKRMVGIWSSTGFGSANGYAFIALFGLPFVFVWYVRKPSIVRLVATIGAVCLSMASIVASGTRGALLVAAVTGLGAILLVRTHRARNLALVGALIVAVFIAAPASLRHRYTGQLLSFMGEAEPSGKFEQIAARSAESRVEGLIDGYLLCLQRPILGWGPGTSPTARTILHPQNVRDEPLQLHSLYGQVLAETGICGTVLFVWLNVYLIVALIRMLRYSSGLPGILATVLLSAFAINILYGFVAHTLFGYNWIVLFALGTVLVSEAHIQRHADRAAAASRFHSSPEPAWE